MSPLLAWRDYEFGAPAARSVGLGARLLLPDASSIGQRRVSIESPPSVNHRMARPPRPLADVEPLAGNPGRDLGSRSDAQLGPHVVHVRLGGPRRDVQLSGNLLACEPLRDQAGYFNLALGQAARWFPLHSRNRTPQLSGLFCGQLSTFRCKPA